MPQMRFSFTDAGGATYDKTLSDEEVLTLVNALAAWMADPNPPERAALQRDTAMALLVSVLETDVYDEAHGRHRRSLGLPDEADEEGPS